MNDENLNLTKDEVQAEKVGGDTLLISVKEACKIVGIGKSTMLKLVKIKGFPAIILPR